MKNFNLIMMTLIMCLVSAVSFGQNLDSVYVIKEIDSMNGKTYVYGNRNFICADDNEKIGFKISAYINSDKLSFSMITAIMSGIGSCNENDEIIVLFENGAKITKRSFNEFNCEGKAYFRMNEEEIQLLRTQTLSKIRMSNGRSYDSYTGNVNQKDKRYFIQLFYCLDNKFFKEDK